MDKDIVKSSTFFRGETARSGVLDNPLDFIAEDHMREREVCALIDRIVSAAALQNADIHRILTFLEAQLPQHLADEEIDLFPMMLKRCDPEDEIEKVIDKLHQDHGHAVTDALAIIAVIQSAAIPSELSEEDRQRLTDFAYQSRRHLILENAIILPIARGRLTPDDLAEMKQHMLERRGLPADTETD